MLTLQNAALVAVTAIVTMVAPSLFTLQKTTPPAAGSCNEDFKDVETIFSVTVSVLFCVNRYYGQTIEELAPFETGSYMSDYELGQNLETGRDLGGAFAVYHKGALVCDLWGGWADLGAERAWDKDTITILFSATKGLAALCIALLRDRGLVDYDSLISDFWPDFGQKGKENITIRMLLSHQAGLAAITTGELTYAMIRDDPEAVGVLLAAQEPNWPPGERFGYHALSFGLYVDQLVRRIDPHHRSLDQFFREEVAVAYDIDLSIGLPMESHYRVARLEALSPAQSVLQALKNINVFALAWNFIANSDAGLMRAFTNPGEIDQFASGRLNWPEYQRTPLASMFGYGSARALGRLYGILADGGKTGTPGAALLSPATIAIVDTPVSPGPVIDAVLGAERHWGHGFQHFQEPEVRTGYTSFGHTGYGGQVGFANTAYRAGWAYITNHPSLYLDQHRDPRIMLLEKALFETLRKLG